MRMLPSALTAAQRRPSRKPYMNVEIAANFPGIRNLIWDNLVTNSNTGPHDTEISTGGYMTRLWVIAGPQLRNQYTDIMADPISWSGWAPMRSNTRLCAIAATGMNLWAFAVDDGTPTQVYLSESTDGGSSWGAFSLVFTHSNTITTISAAVKWGTTDLCVIVNDTSEIAAYRRLSSVWQAKVLSSISSTITGLAIEYEADWDVVATGDGGTDAFVASLIFGDGYSQAVGTWSSRRDIAAAVLTANIAYSHPNLAYPDVFRATFREVYSGTVAYDRIMHTNMPATADYVNNLWREPIPLLPDKVDGLCLTAAPLYPWPLFLTAPGRVDEASLTIPYVDVTADLIVADLHDSSPDHPTVSKIVLDNAHGRYDTLGSGDNLAIRKGSVVRCSPGYYTPDDTTYPRVASSGPESWIVGIDRNYPKKGGSATITLHLGDVWTFFQRWVAPTTHTWLGTKNWFQLLSFLCARLAFEFSSAGSSSSTFDRYPDFTITAGTTGLAALRSLFRFVPDLFFSRGHFLYVRYCEASDPTDAEYAYQPDRTSQHEITAADYRDALKDSNHQRAFCGPDGDILGEAIDYADIALFYASARHHADPNADTGPRATTRAEAEQRKVDIMSPIADRIITPVHCGVELYDIIELTDARIGMTAEKRRVLHIHTVYRRDRPVVYEQTLTLGAP